MDIPQEKSYLCAICKKGRIIETRIEHTNEAATMCDIQNCDFSDYSDYKVNGGRLLAKRPDQHWDSETSVRLGKLLNKPQKEPPIGGICTECLGNPIVLSLVNYIQFENKSR